MPSLAAPIRNGDLDLSVTFQVSPGNVPYETYIWSSATPDGECSLRYNTQVDGFYLSPYRFFLRVRGVDVLVAAVDGSASGAATPQGWDDGDVVTMRAWYKPSLGISGLRCTVTGCTSPDAVGTTIGGALASATASVFGTSPSGAEILSGRLLSSGTGDAGPVRALTPEWAFLGDSTSNSPTIGGPLGARVYTYGQAYGRCGIASFAMAGETTTQQLGRLQASTYWGWPGLRVIVIQTGINDGNSLSTSDALAAYASAISTIRSAFHGALILTALTIPWSQTNAGTIAALNAAMMAGIAGADATISSHYQALGGGAQSLLPQYQFQAGPHDNSQGRIVNAYAYQYALLPHDVAIRVRGISGVAS